MSTTDRFRPFQWLYPGYHQPIEAVAVLLVDLLRTKNSEHTSKTKVLIENLFTNLQDEHSFIKYGQKLNENLAKRPFASAWAEVDVLRRKIWSGMGWEKAPAWLSSSGSEMIVQENGESTHGYVNTSCTDAYPTRSQLRYTGNESSNAGSTAYCTNMIEYVHHEAAQSIG